MSQLDSSKVVGDSSDPGGTLRPNLPPEPTTGDNFDPLPHPEFESHINLPKDVNPMDPIAIFDLFYSPEQMNILVANTNKHGPFWSRIGPRRKSALEWVDAIQLVSCTHT